MTVNRALVLDTLDLIEDNLDRWDQGSFVAADKECGTTMCFAGWALCVAGYRVRMRDNEYLPGTPYPYFETADGIDLPSVLVDLEAARVLGISRYQAERIFYTFPSHNPGNAALQREIFGRFKDMVLQVTGLTEEDKSK